MSRKRFDREERLEGEVVDLSSDGRGVVRTEGKTVFVADAEGLCRQLRLRLLLAGRAPSFAQDWAARLVDGQSWQPPGLAADPDAPGAVLALATGEPAFDPQGQAADDPRRAVAQARALCRLQEAGWL